MENNLRKHLTFGFEQTFTIPEWWSEKGFTSTSDTPLKRERMLDLARELAIELKGRYFESRDIWDHMQYEVTDSTQKTQFYVTMDPGSIEVKTPPCHINQVLEMAAPLFIAAQRASVTAYRNWWYGVQGGTEGGCHVNMGGHTHKENPLVNEPELVVKYAAYVHNRPWLHHPFMGLDVGEGGNAMRMDEKSDFKEVQGIFENYRNLCLSGKNTLSAQQTYDFFKETSLITEKASFPSLYKFKEGLFLIEDRAQEALREAEDFYLVSLIRLEILEALQKHKAPESLKSFPNLHKEDLVSFNLWDHFKVWAQDFSFETSKFKRFFDRQFPCLEMGRGKPRSIKIKDGRRPRVITHIEKRGDVIISKSIDTSFKRFEIYYEHGEEENIDISITALGIEKISHLMITRDDKNFISFLYIDLKFSLENPDINISLSVNSKLKERGIFNPNDMTWQKESSLF